MWAILMRVAHRAPDTIGPNWPAISAVHPAWSFFRRYWTRHAAKWWLFERPKYQSRANPNPLAPKTPEKMPGLRGRFFCDRTNSVLRLRCWAFRRRVVGYLETTVPGPIHSIVRASSTLFAWVAKMYDRETRWPLGSCATQASRPALRLAIETRDFIARYGQNPRGRIVFLRQFTRGGGPDRERSPSPPS